MNCFQISIEIPSLLVIIFHGGWNGEEGERVKNVEDPILYVYNSMQKSKESFKQLLDIITEPCFSPLAIS